MNADPSIEEQAEQELRHLRAVDLSDFMDQAPTAWPFTLYPLVPRRLVTLLTGHGGAGKSIFALTLLAHVACGKEWAGFGAEGGRAVYVSLEDAADLVRYRLRRICEAYALDPDLVARNLVVLDGSGGDAALATEVNDGGIRRLIETPLMQEVEEAAAGAAVVAIDNASDAFDGEENVRRQVRTFLRRLVDIATANDCAVILLAHIDKAAARFGSNGNSYSGSTAWHNSVRSRLALTPADDGRVTLTHEKHTLTKGAEPVTLQWNAAGVLVPAKPGTVADQVDRDRSDVDAALRVMLAARRVGVMVPTGASGPATSWHAVTHLRELQAGFQGKDARRRFHAALVQLQDDGCIARAPFKTSYRNTREAWELTQAGEKIAKECALYISPIPPSATNARAGSALVGTDAPTPATSATNAGRAYRAARDGEL